MGSVLKVAAQGLGQRQVDTREVGNAVPSPVYRNVAISRLSVEFNRLFTVGVDAIHLGSIEVEGFVLIVPFEVALTTCWVGVAFLTVGPLLHLCAIDLLYDVVCLPL